MPLAATAEGVAPDRPVPALEPCDGVARQAGGLDLAQDTGMEPPVARQARSVPFAVPALYVTQNCTVTSFEHASVAPVPQTR